VRGRYVSLLPFLLVSTSEQRTSTNKYHYTLNEHPMSTLSEAQHKHPNCTEKQPQLICAIHTLSSWSGFQNAGHSYAGNKTAAGRATPRKQNQISPENTCLRRLASLTRQRSFAAIRLPLACMMATCPPSHRPLGYQLPPAF